MSQTAKSVRTGLLAIAFFALVVAATPRVFTPDAQASGSVDKVTVQPHLSVATRASIPAV